DRGAQREQNRNRVPPQQVADRYPGCLFGLEKLRRLGHARADVEPGGADQEAKYVRDAPAPIDELLMRELRRQEEAEQRDDDRDDAGRGPLPTCAEAATLAAVLDQKSNGAAEFAANRKP